MMTWMTKHIYDMNTQNVPPFAKSWNAHFWWLCVGIWQFMLPKFRMMTLLKLMYNVAYRFMLYVYSLHFSLSLLLSLSPSLPLSLSPLSLSPSPSILLPLSQLLVKHMTLLLLTWWAWGLRGNRLSEHFMPASTTRRELQNICSV